MNRVWRIKDIRQREGEQETRRVSGKWWSATAVANDKYTATASTTPTKSRNKDPKPDLKEGDYASRSTFC